MSDERNVYLEDIPVEDAWAALTTALDAHGRGGLLEGIDVPVRQALGRVTAAPVVARLSAPHYHAAAMDGYAVRAADTVGATETRPVTLAHTQVRGVNTGAALAAEFDAVIMIENVQEGAGGITITAPVAPWQHVRMLGEDMVATEIVVPAGQRLRPMDLGAIAGCGHTRVSVRRRPTVVLVPTGSELVSAEGNPQPGQVIEYNSLVLAAQVEEAGGEAVVLPITPDEREALRAAFDQALALGPDLVLLLSGSSAGTRDFTSKLVQERGRLLVHGVAVRPGHPVIIGQTEGGVPVIGVPGYPVSAALTGELFIQPLLARWLGTRPDIRTRPRLPATATRRIVSPAGDDDYVRVTVAEIDGRLLATPLSRGAGVITSLVRADGLAHIPRFSEGVDRGGALTVILYRSVDEIRQTALITGSHDPMLDLLAGQLAAHHPGSRLTSASVGSLGGLVALGRGETHLAGMHLLDEASGEYNLPFLERQLKTVPVQVVTFAHREQGLVVPAGNPAGVRGLEDLPRLRYINRQRGAGTRVLLDYLLKQRDIDPQQVDGYAQEAYTHLAVAGAVASGAADCGLAVRSAAIALGLDFIAIGWERYDLVIPRKHLAHPVVGQLIDVVQSEDFRAVLGKQPGYDVRETGRVVAG
jgi:putative molybdopterin biosynthesis protein